MTKAEKRAEREKRVQTAAARLAHLYSDREIVTALSLEFDCSQKLAGKYLQAAKNRSPFASRDRRAIQDTFGFGYLGLHRAALTRKGKVKGECPQCGEEVQVEVPKPALSTAKGVMDSMVALWKAQASPEDMLSSDELRAATVQAMLAQADRFTTEELTSMLTEFQAIVERRAPAQLPLL
jgi:hypothetical protein